jgi:hypothetical protein
MKLTFKHVNVTELYPLAPSSTPRVRDSAIDKIEVKLSHLKKNQVISSGYPESLPWAGRSRVLKLSLGSLIGWNA